MNKTEATLKLNITLELRGKSKQDLRKQVIHLFARVAQLTHKHEEVQHLSCTSFENVTVSGPAGLSVNE